MRGSLWFLPTLMAIGATVAALATVTLDETIQAQGLRPLPGIYRGGPDGARAVLSTIAGSMVGLTGITFSITIVALTLASTQFGPRLLKNFLRDRGNQIVLGTFIATFLYCLMVLRRVHGSQTEMFVPHVAVTVGILLVMASVGVLIFFIHHVSQSIQAAHVIALVGRDLDEAVERFYPEMVGDAFDDSMPAPPAGQAPPDFAQTARSIKAAGSGYIQAIDSHGLMRLATEQDILLQINYLPGRYVIAGTDLASVWPPERADDALAAKINAVFIIGIERTGEQDPEYAVHQLVEVAVRALSPGINDPFTAINCIDRLGTFLAKLAERSVPSAYRYDEQGKLRVITEFNAFSDLTKAAFDQIRQAGRGNAAVTIRLLEVIAGIAKHIRRKRDRLPLLRQATMIERGSHTGLPEEEDRKDVQARFAEIMKLVG